jgi:uncharacterized membrane protein YkvI
MDRKKLDIIGVASMYIGVIMGAGFASGRECWQYFGVFGRKGYFGAVLATLCFMAVGCMLSYISLSKDTQDLGRLVSPTDDHIVTSTVGWVVAAIYYSMIIAMTAAGGSLLSQQFGLDKKIGGVIIAALVIFTVLGDFERVSGIFKKLVPLIFMLSILTIVLVLSSDITQSGRTSGYRPGEMTPNWVISAIVFISYNCIGMITMAGASARNAKDRKSAFGGAVLGTALLGVITVLLLTALLRDMAFSSRLDLPMLGYSARINPVLNACYAVVLFGAVYSTAASTYYGFSTKLPKGRSKNWIIVSGAIIGFALGLTGFKKIVEYLYTAQGYIGLVIILLIAVNFFSELKKNRSDRQQTGVKG